ncbi:unnamed protein product [Schistosoma curassoni]|uniref:Uncharacterized protein n=1 Tax=Schistosoma curassoni TaxID=6186 RepID=A0A3P8AHU6_9TREM|nr:unnamed protein product [Schistosoma curassoni]
MKSTYCSGIFPVSILISFQPESLQGLKIAEFTNLVESKTHNPLENIESAVIMLKFMIYLYHSKPAIRLVFTTPGLLINLIGLLIPFTNTNNDPSAYSSPLKRSALTYTVSLGAHVIIRLLLQLVRLINPIEIPFTCLSF